MANVNYAQDSANSSNRWRFPREDPSPHGIPFKHTVTLATTDLDTATDTWDLFHFPSGASLDLDSLVVNFGDLDSNGSPNLVIDIGISDGDGTIDTVLIDNSTAGQNGGIDRVDDSAISSNGKFLSVSDKYLSGDIVSVAATADG